MNWLKDTPWWVLAIALALSAIEPVTHFGLQRIDNEHAVHSGLHTPDSAIYLTCMKMLDNDFFSPYATCKAPNGPNDPAFLPTPFHWLYAVLGEIGRWFGIGEFMFLGLANGFFGFVYLIVVYRFLKTAVPNLANLAFILWALGGGLGGVVWFWAMATDSLDIEPVLFRFAAYELIEGPGFFPLLHIPRLYYTSSLALGFGALLAFIHALRNNSARLHWVGIALLFLSTLINIRHGGIFWAIIIIYLICQPPIGSLRRLSLAVVYLVPVMVAGLIFFAMLQARSSFLPVALEIVRESIWPTAFLSSALFHLPLLAYFLLIRIKTLPIILRVLVLPAVAYLCTLFPLFMGYRIYHGDFWLAGDHAALAATSDYALIGAVIAFIAVAFGVRKLFTGAGDPFIPAESTIAVADDNSRYETTDWFLLWSLAFMVLGMSAFGQGWGVRLVPQRLLVFLGVPLAVLSAHVLMSWHSTAPRIVRGYALTFVLCGVVSILAGSLYFQAPVGRSLAEKTFAKRHVELISTENLRLIRHIEGGVVMTHPALADAVAMLSNAQVLGGIGATDLSDVNPSEIEPYTSAAFRYGWPHFFPTDHLQEWCVSYVLMPETSSSIPPPEISHYQRAWVALVAREGNGALYSINHDAIPERRRLQR